LVWVWCLKILFLVLISQINGSDSNWCCFPPENKGVLLDIFVCCIAISRHYSSPLDSEFDSSLMHIVSCDQLQPDAFPYSWWCTISPLFILRFFFLMLFMCIDLWKIPLFHSSSSFFSVMMIFWHTIKLEISSLLAWSFDKIIGLYVSSVGPLWNTGMSCLLWNIQLISVCLLNCLDLIFGYACICI